MLFISSLSSDDQVTNSIRLFLLSMRRRERDNLANTPTNTQEKQMISKGKKQNSL